MRIARYFLVGGTAAAVDIGIFAIFAKTLGYNYLVVGAVGFMLGVMVNYLLSVRHVFESGARFKKHEEIGWVYLISGVGLLVNQLVLYVGIDQLGMEMMLTKLFATGSVFFWNYGARAHFVFKPIASKDSGESQD